MVFTPASLEVLKNKYNFKMCNTTFQKIIDEIREEIRLGRYDECTLIDEKPIMVSPLVFIDYMSQRKLLRGKNTRKYVRPFDPQVIARNYIGIDEEVLEDSEIIDKASDLAIKKILRRMGGN